MLMRVSRVVHDFGTTSIVFFHRSTVLAFVFYPFDEKRLSDLLQPPYAQPKSSSAGFTTRAPDLHIHQGGCHENNTTCQTRIRKHPTRYTWARKSQARRFSVCSEWLTSLGSRAEKGSFLCHVMLFEFCVQLMRSLLTWAIKSSISPNSKVPTLLINLRSSHPSSSPLASTSPTSPVRSRRLQQRLASPLSPTHQSTAHSSLQ